MQRLVLGVLIGVGLMMLAQAAVNRPEQVLAQVGNRQATTEELLTHTASLADGGEQLCVVDPQLRVVAIYHIDPVKGELALRSVRNIYWDLRMNHFNGVSPLPQEIRSLLEQN
jgi:hypothetical protein